MTMRIFVLLILCVGWVWASTSTGTASGTSSVVDTSSSSTADGATGASSSSTSGSSSTPLLDSTSSLSSSPPVLDSTSSLSSSPPVLDSTSSLSSSPESSSCDSTFQCTVGGTTMCVDCEGWCDLNTDCDDSFDEIYCIDPDLTNPCQTCYLYDSAQGVYNMRNDLDLTYVYTDGNWDNKAVYYAAYEQHNTCGQFGWQRHWYVVLQPGEAFQAHLSAGDFPAGHEIKFSYVQNKTRIANYEACFPGEYEYACEALTDDLIFKNIYNETVVVYYYIYTRIGTGYGYVYTDFSLFNFTDDSSSSSSSPSSLMSSSDPSATVYGTSSAEDPDDFTCYEGYFKCPSTNECEYCSWWCDGIVDCANGDDEAAGCSDLNNPCYYEFEESYSASTSADSGCGYEGYLEWNEMPVSGDSNIPAPYSYWNNEYISVSGCGSYSVSLYMYTFYFDLCPGCTVYITQNNFLGWTNLQPYDSSIECADHYTNEDTYCTDSTYTAHQYTHTDYDEYEPGDVTMVLTLTLGSRYYYNWGSLYWYIMEPAEDEENPLQGSTAVENAVNLLGLNNYCHSSYGDAYSCHQYIYTSDWVIAPTWNGCFSEPGSVTWAKIFYIDVLPGVSYSYINFDNEIDYVVETRAIASADARQGEFPAYDSSFGGDGWYCSCRDLSEAAGTCDSDEYEYPSDTVGFYDSYTSFWWNYYYNNNLEMKAGRHSSFADEETRIYFILRPFESGISAPTETVDFDVYMEPTCDVRWFEVVVSPSSYSYPFNATLEVEITGKVPLNWHYKTTVTVEGYQTAAKAQFQVCLYSGSYEVEYQVVDSNNVYYYKLDYCDGQDYYGNCYIDYDFGGSNQYFFYGYSDDPGSILYTLVASGSEYIAPAESILCSGGCETSGADFDTCAAATEFGSCYDTTYVTGCACVYTDDTSSYSYYYYSYWENYWNNYNNVDSYSCYCYATDSLVADNDELSEEETTILVIVIIAFVVILPIAWCAYKYSKQGAPPKKKSGASIMQMTPTYTTGDKMVGTHQQAASIQFKQEMCTQCGSALLRGMNTCTACGHVKGAASPAATVDSSFNSIVAPTTNSTNMPPSFNPSAPTLAPAFDPFAAPAITAPSPYATHNQPPAFQPSWGEPSTGPPPVTHASQFDQQRPPSFSAASMVSCENCGTSNISTTAVCSGCGLRIQQSI